MVASIERGIPHNNLLCTAEALLGRRANVSESIEGLRQKPEILDQLVTDFDETIRSFNEFLISPEEVVRGQRELVPHAFELRRILSEAQVAIPTITDLEHPDSKKVAKAEVKAFIDANRRMRRGESGEKEQPRWDFHKSLTDPSELAAALIFEIYGRYVANAYPELKDSGLTTVLALEELLAIHYQDTALFQKVKPWYTAEEGFSPLLVDIANGRMGMEFNERSVRRDTPNFQVIDISRDGEEQFLLIAKRPGAQSMLVEAVRQDTACDLNVVCVEDGDGNSRVELRVPRTAESVRALLGGWSGGKIPSPDKMEQCLRLKIPYSL